jgi:hypothetical protein
MMGEATEGCCGHISFTEDKGPFIERRGGGNDIRGAFEMVVHVGLYGI